MAVMPQNPWESAVFWLSVQIIAAWEAARYAKAYVPMWVSYWREYYRMFGIELPDFAAAPAAEASTPAPQPVHASSEREGRLEEALTASQAALALSEQGRAAFLSAMSHELRTPLNAIMGFAEMMKNGVFGPLGNPTYAEYAQHIHDSGGELLSKVNDLLSIGSMHGGGFALDESRFTLSELLAE